jgi:haloacetate dehalogenase
MVLWSEQGSLGDIDPIKVWRDWADYVKGEAIAAGHFLPEEAPTLRRVCCWTF